MWVYMKTWIRENVDLIAVVALALPRIVGIPANPPDFHFVLINNMAERIASVLAPLAMWMY